MKYAVPSFLLVAAAALALTISGCTPSPAPVDPVAAHAAQVAMISNDIKVGVSTAVSLGLTAIPDPAEAKTDADLALNVINSNIMPILNGDNAGLTNGIGEIMNLSAFNDPKLAKVKMIMEVALPILQTYLPADLTANAVGGINPDVKTYLVSFFTGVSNGITTYEGGAKAMPAGKRDFTDFADLRKKLSAK